MKKLFYTLLLIVPFLTFSQTKKELKVISKAEGDIVMKVDKFEGTTTWDSPIFGTGIAATLQKSVRFIKTKSKDGLVRTYLSVSTNGLTLNTNEKGFILLFEDGTRFEKPGAEVDVDVADGGAWRYSVFIPITDEELDLFATKKIEGYKLYIYENNYMMPKDILRYMGYARGIQKSN